MAAGVYAGGRRICDIRVEDAHEWTAKAGHVVWIGLHDPSYDLLARIQAQFGLHDLAIEDAGKSHNHPKLELYGDALFIVARTAQLVDGRVAFGETHIFVGRGYVVTVRHGASVSYAAVRHRCKSCPTVLSSGEHYILHAILDFIVDNYMPVTEAVHVEVEEIEDRVLTTPLGQEDIERLHILRRDLLRLRSAAVPLVEVCRRLEHADVLPVAPGIKFLFRDVTDHIHMVAAEIDTLRELLAFLFEASVMIGKLHEFVHCTGGAHAAVENAANTVKPCREAESGRCKRSYSHLDLRFQHSLRRSDQYRNRKTRDSGVRKSAR